MEEERQYDYATFGQRLAAILIDGLIIGVVASILGFIFGALFVSGVGLDAMVTADELDEGTLIMGILTYIAFLGMMLVGSWLYFALQESSNKMATIGKKAMGIVVTDMDGNRISFARASGRYFGKIISGAIMYVGYIMAAFTEKKQALHDMMANCLVMRSN